MKKLVMIAAAAIAVSATTGYTPIAKADNLSLRICEYVSVNDKNRLRKFLKDNKLKIRNIFDSIQCNNQNLLVFAATSNALDTGELFIQKLPKNTVQENIEAIKAHSAHLAAKAEERVK